MTKLNIEFLNIGDRLVRNKKGSLVGIRHHVLYVGFWNNQHLVAENQTGYGVRCIPLKQFLGEGALKRVEYNNFDKNSQKIIISRVNKRLGKSYILLEYNCEGFVNEILTGIPKSKQIQNAGVGVLALGVIGLVAALSS
jgi:hypothetical protein